MDEYKVMIKGANRYSKRYLNADICYLDRFAESLCDMYDYLKRYEGNLYVDDLLFILSELALNLRIQYR